MGNNAGGRLGLSKGTLTVNSPEPIIFPKHIQISKIACGWGHSLALSTSGTVFSWGCGKTGALGNGLFENSYKPQQIHITEEKMISVVCGSQHSGFLSSSGKLYMCGFNHNGQLGIGCRDNKAACTLIKGINDPIDQIQYRTYLKDAPAFTRGEVSKLRDFIKNCVKTGDNKDLLYHIEYGRIRPSKSLQDSIASMLKGNDEFLMLDEQKVS